jgi:endoribonuclease Dicer
MSISYMLSQVYVVEDRNEIESFSPGATIVNKYYDPYLFDLDKLESKLQILYEKVIQLNNYVSSDALEKYVGH